MTPGFCFGSLHVLRFFLVFTLLGYVLFMHPAIGVSDSSSKRNAEKKKIEKGIDQQQIKIRRLNQGIEKQQQQVQESRQQERDLLTELEDIDTRIYKQQDKLEVLETRMQEQRQLIEKKKSELNQVQTDKKGVQNHLQKRIEAYYKMGDIGFINVAFSSKTLPELLKFREAFHQLIMYDRSVIKDYRETIEELERAVDALILEEALQEEFIFQETREKTKLDQIRQEKETLLTHIRTQAKLHEQAIVEMAKASESLTSALKALKVKEELVDQSFLSSKGQLPPPVSGIVITQFQKQTTNRLGIISRSQGIAIKAPSGTMVQAVHEGEVTFAGYLRGYGNTVIVNHGYKYYSINSRIERILVKKGQKVTEQTDIAIMGDTATLMNEGLYFEIRHDDETLDPLDWLDNTQLTFSQ